MKASLPLLTPLLGLLALSLFATAGCDAPGGEPATVADTMVVETMADTVAMRVYDSMGGPQAWAALPHLQFDFATGNDTSRTLRARHLWNRATGDYRVEMPAGQDSLYVATFNVNTREGDVYLNGEAVEGESKDELLEQAYARFINDSYWLLMPVKMMDPGVQRSYEADSSTDAMEVVRLSFDSVGLTPGDQYWVYVDRESGRVDHWAYHLQRQPADHIPRPIRWTDYKSFDTPHGTITVAERKVGDGFVIYTDNVEVPDELPEGAFSDPNPVLIDS